MIKATWIRTHVAKPFRRSDRKVRDRERQLEDHYRQLAAQRAVDRVDDDKEALSWD